MSIGELVTLLPLFSDLVALWKNDGKDPKAELEALLGSVDAATWAAIRAKFG